MSPGEDPGSRLPRAKRRRRKSRRWWKRYLSPLKKLWFIGWLLLAVGLTVAAVWYREHMV
jgi:hypothetical protein